jgi:secretion/DNA translocation related TadE-like protein
MRGRARGEEGFTTVASLGLVAVLGLFTTMVLAVGVLQVQRHRAESAADLAALAAAQHVLEGPDVACARARTAAAAQGVSVDRCEVVGLEVVVHVSVPLPGRLRPFGPLRSRARAGRR